MNFDKTLNKVINKVISDFINEVATKYDLNKKDLLNVWNNTTEQQIVVKESTTCQELDEEESEPKKKTDLNVNDLQNASLPELKAFCKERGLKCGGKKSELFDRLLEWNKKGETHPVKEKAPLVKSVKKKVETKDIIKQLKTNSSQIIQARRNAFGNYQYPNTNLVFNQQKKIYGIQNDDGTVSPLSMEDIDMCNKYNLDYVLPENLAGDDDDDVAIPEIKKSKKKMEEEIDENEEEKDEEEDELNEEELINVDDDEEEEEIPLDDEEF